MKTLYCNGYSSIVQVSNENKKTSKPVGSAKMLSVFRATLEGGVRTFALENGQRVGVSVAVWNEFMSIHDDTQTRENLIIESLPAL